MKKGFTLIELLAVIVILAIIALIATPIVLNIINDVKENSVKRSIGFYLDAVEQAVARKNLTTLFTPHECEITLDGNLLCNGNQEIEVEVSGEKPTEGLITFKDGNIENYRNIKIGNKYARIGEEDVLLTDDYKSVCVQALEPVFGNFPEDISFAPGYEYICEVGPEEYHNFVVLSSDENDVTLLLLESLGTSSWATKEDFLAAGGSLTDWNATKEDYPTSKGKYTLGPVTAIKFINEKTKTWVNVKNLNEEYKDHFGHYTMHLTGKARLTKGMEIYNSLYDVIEYGDGDILDAAESFYGGDFIIMDSADGYYFLEDEYNDFDWVSFGSVDSLMFDNMSFMVDSKSPIVAAIKMSKEDFEFKYFDGENDGKYEEKASYDFGNYTCVPAAGKHLEFTYTLSSGVKTETYNTGTKNIGDAYACKVNDSTQYLFNVIGKSGDNVDLIMNTDLAESQWSVISDNSGKPTKLLENLKTLTDTWTNINTRTDSQTIKFTNITLVEEGSLEQTSEETTHTIDYTGYRARIASYDEMSNAINNSSNKWYHSNLHYDYEQENNGGFDAYWLMSDTTISENVDTGVYPDVYSTFVAAQAGYVGVGYFGECNWEYYEGLLWGAGQNIYDDVIYCGSWEFSYLFGVRPVITVPSSKIK